MASDDFGSALDDREDGGFAAATAEDWRESEPLGWPAEAEARAPEREAPSRLDGIDASDPRHALKRYLREIAPLPTLTRAQEQALAQEYGEAAQRWRLGLLSLPCSAAAAVERWRRIKREERVSATLSASHRDGTGEDYSPRVDAALGRVAALLERRERLLAPREPGVAARLARLDRSLAKALGEANLADEVLQSIHVELREKRAELDRFARPAAPPATGGVARLATAGARTSLRRLERGLGLTAAAFRARMSEIERAHAELLDAKNRFVRHNLKLVVAVAKDFRNMGIPFLDLIQEGNLGLIRAVEKFDHTRGFKFSTYAVWWIRQSFIRSIQNHSRTVRLPSHVYDLMLQYKRAYQKLSGVLGRDPSPDELRLEMKLDDEPMAKLLEMRQKPVSLDETVPGTESKRVEDVLADPDAETQGDGGDLARLQTGLERMVAELSDRERAVLRWRFGMRGEDEHTLQEIGERLGLSRERVRQIEAGALAKLRPRARELGLSDLLERDGRGPAAGLSPVVSLFG